MASAIRIYRSLEEAGTSFGPCAVTVGNFDGIHSGHRKILRRVVALAREHGWKPSALTFHPHPTQVVAPSRAPKLLSTPEQRAAWMAEEGIEQVLILPFDRAFSALTAEEFVRKVLVDRLGARAVLVGDNFRFGHKHAGDTRLLRELGEKFGFCTEVIHAVRIRGRMISSSEIRRLVEAGSVYTAWRLLERPYALLGKVIGGRGIGSRQTVPTLNLGVEGEILPATGVYVTRTRDLDDERQWQSVTNVGYRPTFDGEGLSVESFLLSPFDGETPARIQVEFLHRLRDERKFQSPEELKAQILKDAGRALAWFRRCGRWQVAIR
jgi:riboflavin kinase / FMN adenylyltransferase